MGRRSAAEKPSRGRELQREQRRQRRAQRAQSKGEPVVDRLFQRGIAPASSTSALTPSGCGPSEQGGAAQRDADHAEALAGRRAAQEAEDRPRVEAFQIPEGDPLAAALAVGPGVEEEHGVAGGMEEARAIHHVEPARADAVEEQDRARARAGPATSQPRRVPAAGLSTRTPRPGRSGGGGPTSRGAGAARSPAAQ